MLIIPAIDIQDGCVVRFVQGKLDKKVYSKDPVKTARYWVNLGGEFLHVVDLDGARSGEIKNLQIIKDIASSVNVPVEVGGGVRTLESIKDLLMSGVSRVILGTKAAQDRGFLEKAFSLFKDKIIVSIDAKDGFVSIKGWDESLKGTGAIEFGRSLKKMGFKQAIYTDISKDGTLKGPDIKGIKALIKETGLEVIGSGGISSLKDLQKLKLLEKKGLAGIIIGKALYEGKFTLTEALKLTQERS